MPTDIPDDLVTLPLGIGGRWYLPAGPGAAARSALLLAAPFRPAAFAAWLTVRTFASAGGLRLLPRATAPDLMHAELLMPHIPPGGHVAIRPASARGRWTALVLTPAGHPHVLVKAAFTERGRQALRAEAAAQQMVARCLPGGLATPAIVASADDLLVFDAVAWRPRPRSWVLPADVATALGELTKAGVTHGDFAPWNLLATDRGWYVIDWESAREHPDPWADLWHYIVQAHALIGRPSRRAILEGLGGAGWIGDAIRAYAAGAGEPTDQARDALVEHLHRSLLQTDVVGRRVEQARRRRVRLLAEVRRT